MNPATSDRIPVTVLTGFLGAGKTTLLNRILGEHHGQRIAVIENEFGEIGIDHALVINADEEIFEMNNGCICCTVRGDLIRILGNLLRRRDKFDAILIETTGLADPGPVAQTFFVDDELAEQFRLDAVVTVVDAKHVQLHLDDSAEVREQIAFADVMLLNKADLVSDAELDALEKRVRGMNALARVHRTRHAEIDLDAVLNVGGFDLERALSVKPTFLEPEYPFEWAGLFRLEAGDDYQLVLHDGPDPTLRLAWLRVDPGGEPIEASLEAAVRRFAEPPVAVLPEARLTADSSLVELDLDVNGPKRFAVSITRPGDYVLYTQHHPGEFELRLRQNGNDITPLAAREFDAGHEHDDEVTSVGIEAPGDLDQDRFNDWIGKLLRERGADIFRSKGIVSLQGMEKRLIFHAVHMLMDMRTDRPWGDEARHNQLVFIGRNLDRGQLQRGFEACQA
ncbi:CobW family GTP-binding protein [Methylolobus aquaticus]